MSGPRIVIVGGGSVGWTPRIVRDMLLTESLADADYVLYDIDKPAADLTKAYADQLRDVLGCGARFTATDQRARAFRGADYFIITISTGGFDAMAHDLAVPEDYGIYHTVGDTVGPGGWARTIRNFDVFVDLAAAVRKYASGSVVLNYTNPMTTLTGVLAALHDGPVVGLCHGLFENLRFLVQFYKLGGEDDLAVQYGGLNHFFWITAARARGRDLLADLRRRLKRQSLTDLLHETYQDPAGFESNRYVADELFRLTGVMPYFGDRHTCECFPQYITSKANLKAYKIVRTSIDDRRQMRRKGRANLRRTVRQGVQGPFERSRETAADIIDAHVRGRTFIDVGNVPNVGQIENLPRGLVVETAVRVDANGFSPIHFGALPAAVEGFAAPVGRTLQLTLDACWAKDRHMAVQALRLDPLCSHLTTPQVEEMAGRLMKAHRKFIKGWT